MRSVRSATRLLLLVLLFLGVADSSTASILVHRISSDVIPFDDSQGITATYVAFSVENTGPVDYTDLWMTLDTAGSASVQLALWEDGAYRIGSLAFGETKPAYLYVEALAETVSIESLDVDIREGSTASPAVASATFPFSVIGTLIGQSQRVTSIDYTPANPSVGDTVRLAVSGETGVVSDPFGLILTPASLPDWPADVFELIDVSVTVSATGGGCTTPIASVEHDLFVQLPDAGPFCFVAEYTFRLTSSTVVPTTVSPTHFVKSGQTTKHPQLDCQVLDCELPAIAPGPVTVVPSTASVVSLLRQNHPNPFNPRTVIPFSLEKEQHVFLAVYDVAGRRVRTLLRETLPAGSHQVVWNGLDERGLQVASGVYLYTLHAGSHDVTKRMTLSK